MENSVHALLIVAGVLIGIMILSLGISLYSSLREYIELTQEEILNNEIKQFNAQFTKYINCEDSSSKEAPEFSLTIQDIVTAANAAYENNISNGNNYYVTINMPGCDDLETKINSQLSTILSNCLGNEYKCSYEDVKINPESGRVFEVTFHNYKAE